MCTPFILEQVCRVYKRKICVIPTVEVSEIFSFSF